jgi:hypothetical protein
MKLVSVRKSLRESRFLAKTFTFCIKMGKNAGLKVKRFYVLSN